MSALARGIAGAAVYAAVCAALVGFLSPVMHTASAASRSIYLVLAGPVGALTTHLHVIGFSVLTLVLAPLLVSAMVLSNCRRPLLFTFALLWLATGIGFALLWR